MMKIYTFLLMATLGLTAVVATSAGRKEIPPVLNFTVNDIDGKPVHLDRFQGNVIIIVNVASHCGNTPQYASLQKLYQENKKKGLVILAFPSNDFAGQEPGTNAEIKSFCTTNYHVTFPVFSKIVVNGRGQHPLYRYLTDKSTDPKFGGEIEWNFAKFLISRKGEIVARFPAKLDPLTPQVTDAIKQELSKPRK
jgi:glutathione peroxidase